MSALPWVSGFRAPVLVARRPDRHGAVARHARPSGGDAPHGVLGQADDGGWPTLPARKHRDPGPAGTGPEHSGEQVRQLGIEGLRGDQGCRSAPVVELGRRDVRYPAQAASAGDSHAVLRLRGLHHERIRSPTGLRRGAPRPQAGGRTGLHPGRAAFMRGASSRNWDRQRRPCTALPISSSRTGT